ncbi:MAG: glycosyltransferase [Bacteroidota bacterium]
MIGLLTVSFIILFIYCILVIRFYFFWKKAPDYLASSGMAKTQLSVVIPFFNERENLGIVMDSLKAQDYPSDKYEVILVDDHSTDGSYQMVQELGKNIDIVKCVRNKRRKGKKFALYTGIENATNENILITDADCSFSKEWISCFSSFFSEHPELKLISSGVRLSVGENFMQAYQSLEFSSLIASGAASFFQNDPIMCNGANLAFKKDLFFEAFNHILPEINTGDDIFLMLYAKKNYPGQYAFLKNVNAFTTSYPLNNWKALFQQRIRWSSKSNYYRDFHLIFTASFVLLIHLVLLILLIMTFFQSVFFMYFLVFIFIKSIPDFCLLNNYLRYSGQKRLLKYFLPSQLINLIFIPISGIIGILLPPPRNLGK